MGCRLGRGALRVFPVFVGVSLGTGSEGAGGAVGGSVIFFLCSIQ